MSDRLGVDGGCTPTDVLLVEEGSGSAWAGQDRAVGGGAGPELDDGRDERAPRGHGRHRDAHPALTYGVAGAVGVAERCGYRDLLAFDVVHTLGVLHPSALA
jgi:hypothetical protein